jgi:CubicO group peptidase (beta-lactamase class C family)
MEKLPLIGYSSDTMRNVIVGCLLLAALGRAEDVNTRMEQIVQSYVKNQQFMGSVLVAKSNDTLLNKGYGSANLEWAIPNSPTTRFRLGSITKQFTAACVLLLQERGKLQLSDPVKKYVPDALAAWDKITIYNLLTHTSGIPSFTGFKDYRDLEAKPTTPAKLVERFRDKPLEFEPGTKWNYSNSGYVLLGYLIEKISGQTYQQFLEQNILTPLGMKDSGYDSNSAIILHRASGYSPSAHGIINAGYIDMTIPFSAGALYSTTEDLLRWEHGLFGGKILSAASLKAMTTPFKENYGFALGIRDVNGRKEIDHAGGIEGFNTELAYWPDDQLTVIVLGNLNGMAPEEIAGQLAATVHGEKVTLSSERKEIKLQPEVLKQYVGDYQLAPGAILSVTLEADQLETQLTGQEKIPVFAETENKFFPKVVNAELEFTKDTSGKITQLILHQGGRDMPARKVK